MRHLEAGRRVRAIITRLTGRTETAKRMVVPCLVEALIGELALVVEHHGSKLRFALHPPIEGRAAQARLLARAPSVVAFGKCVHKANYHLHLAKTRHLVHSSTAFPIGLELQGGDHPPLK